MIKELINNEIERLSGGGKAQNNHKNSFPQLMIFQDDLQKIGSVSPFKHASYISKNSSAENDLVEKTKEIV